MFVRHVMQLGLANVGAQALSLLIVPILTRLYSPSDFGVFAIYLAILNALVPIASLRFQATMALPTLQEDSRHLLRISLIVLGITVALTSLVSGIVVTGGFMPTEWMTDQRQFLLLLLPLNLAGLGLIQIYSAWTMLQHQVKATAVARITESIVDRATSCLCAFSSATHPFGLIAGRLFGSTAAAWSLWKSSHPSARHVNSPQHLLQNLVPLAKRYGHFALVSSAATLCDSAARQSPALLLAFLFSPAVAGYYALAFQVVNVPLLIAGDALSSTYFQRAARFRKRPDQLAQDTGKLFRSMLSLIIPVTLGLSFLGPKLFGRIFGEEWAQAGEYAQVLAAGFLFMFLHRPISVLFDVYEAQTARFWFDIANLGLRIAVMMGLAAWGGSPILVLLGFTITCAVTYGFALIYLLRMAGISPTESLWTVARQGILFLPLGLGLWAITTSGLFLISALCVLGVALGLQLAVLFKFEREAISFGSLLLPGTVQPR
ncbi:MAG: lipopolysaccharide biosynthesis protein [Nitrospira sp.]